LNEIKQFCSHTIKYFYVLYRFIVRFIGEDCGATVGLPLVGVGRLV